MSVSFREPIRVGIAGLGRAGWGMHCLELEALPALFRIIAVCDPLKDRRDLAVARYGCRAYRRYEDLLADGAVELVDIATRSDDHLAQAVAALKTRKWVNIESPMCLNYDEALVLRAAAVKAGNRLLVRHNQRFNPGFQHVCEIIHSGMLGEVYDIKLRRGEFQRGDDWQTVNRCGGGQLLNWGPHVIDQALQLLDTPPVRIFSDLKRVAAMGDAEDYVRLIMRNANGMTVDLEISGGRIMDEPECLATGTKGALSLSGHTLHLRYLDPKQIRKHRRASVRTPPLAGFGSTDNLTWIAESMPVAPKKPSGASVIWEYLAGAIRLNKSYPVTLDEAVEAMRIVSLARKDTSFV